MRIGDKDRLEKSPPMGIPGNQANVKSTLDNGTIVGSSPGSASFFTGGSPGKDGAIERVILTTYPTQSGIRPVPLNWGASSSEERGPVLASRSQTGPINNLKERNAMGAYGGSYSVYHALAVGSGALQATHRPDFTDTEPPVNIGPYPQWSESDMKIVSMDPWGHIPQTVFKDYLDRGYDLRPTIAVTKAHMRLPELAEGTLKQDGVIVLSEDGEINVTKAAVEPVWWLPGIASRFGIDETKLRRALFEDTGGMYPELITRPDMKVFLPPIGGLTIYVFGPMEYLADPTKKLTVRVHDECNGSDVFGSDICTCRPYLIYGIQRCVETAQKGGVGLIVYFRKEGRALGEVTKFLVYNARKRQAGGDRASTYFQHTENVAGVKDMRFQSLMPDVLHWLGVQKIDEMISMSNMKYDAIVGAGIPILERVPIPDEMVPPDSQVEMVAKVASGYFTQGHVPTEAELNAVKGRTWDDIAH
ncbi:GTP cyclohydrolase II [Paramicrosporidium saccamoebae]|uniref:GTP cyclohydrolase II n=1 Tax=Paramicrosporidium saccamoebae TaxID=1246581 RepID=A0A2H9TQQ0_9FUNG|nr:GTP cyclohydrolase II [Paramicrosporidium saccamoebae]